MCRTGATDDAALGPRAAHRTRGSRSASTRCSRRCRSKDKLAQLQLLPDNQVTEEDVRNGVGAVFSLTDPAKIAELQKIATTESKHKIPLLFAYDTIHGFRTTFPIPLAQASSFDPDVTTTDATIAARETAAVGIKQSYSADGRRVARAALGPHRRGLRRGPVPRARSSRPPA